ncbi:hypothetical protein [Comamonas sp. B21-038]|uniref:hypothetical protein n=1 Tax=Comamonas sp. B21-038 TaxID=2918299 RepID=UPI001EFA2B7E|nr:hypothetical protein [Comamonas sp. B21-038]ULR87435.1 hypothetical protein MJ205_13270 [Comamonas sp. B21-038]
MTDLSNYHALARGQAAWDSRVPDFDPPARMQSQLELQDENFTLRDQLTQLLEEARDLAETANRIRCCTGDRMLRLCNKIEGIEDDE